MTQILVVKPGTLSPADKGKLRKAGVVTVEAERPEDVRLIQAEGPPLDSNDMLAAALKALGQSEGQLLRYSQATFVRLLGEYAANRREAADA